MANGVAVTLNKKCSLLFVKSVCLENNLSGNIYRMEATREDNEICFKNENLFELYTRIKPTNLWSLICAEPLSSLYNLQKIENIKKYRKSANFFLYDDNIANKIDCGGNGLSLYIILLYHNVLLYSLIISFYIQTWV